MLGLKTSENVKKTLIFSEKDKRQIVEDYLQSGLSKQAIWEKYTGRKTEHGKILQWMHKYGYISDNTEKSTTFATQIELMKAENTNREQSDFEILQLQNRISDLEKQLNESQLKSIAWQTMIELAEKEFNVSIKKKFNIKPLKR